MSSFTRVFVTRFALGTALVASACQHDSNVAFDDRALKSPAAGGSGATASSGSDTAGAGDDPGGGSTGGTAGSTSLGGKPTTGTAGTGPAGGTGGGGGGKGGSGAGGSASQGGKAGQGGTAGSVTAGGGLGGSANLEPITVETTDIADTDVGSCMPNMNHGEAVSMVVDSELACGTQILINAPLTIVPDGALVSAASLTLTCMGRGGPITVSYVNEAWDELKVRWNNRPEVGMMIDSITCDGPGEITIDLTGAVKAWVAGDHEADGIDLETNGTRTEFDTSESRMVDSRPKLSITYTLPAK